MALFTYFTFDVVSKGIFLHYRLLGMYLCDAIYMIVLFLKSIANCVITSAQVSKLVRSHGLQYLVVR